MNKKFVKENKQVIKEFLGKLIANIIAGKLNKDLRKQIQNDPKFKSKETEMKRIEKQMLDRIKKMRKNDPDFAKKMAKLGIEVN
jgi:nicotinamide mononucleotide adenylyltransferase|tara:strand:+ start:41 stop:292 length:252 start_codon:yes stop_codon:yes gene_type:complete